MAIYKRKLRSGSYSKFYWTKFRFSGELIQQSTKCTSIRKAEDFERDLRSQLNHGRIGIDTLAERKPKGVKMVVAIERFLAWSEKENKTSTHRRLKTSSAPVFRFFANVADASKITKKDIEAFRDWRRIQKKKAPIRKLKKDPKAKTTATISPATVNRDVAFLSAVFSYLINQGDALKNPVKGVEKLEENNLQERVVDRSEFNAYIMAASQPLRDIATIIYEMGMRPAEVMHLRKADVDFPAGRLRIAKGKTKAARRKLTMTPPVHAILEKRARNPQTDLLFAGGRKGQNKSLGQGSDPIEKVTNAHHGAVTRAKVSPFRLYDLRHTFATDFVAAGGDIVTLAAILGHASLAMVMRYAHPTEQHQATAIARLQRFREGDSGLNVLKFQTVGR